MEKTQLIKISDRVIPLMIMQTHRSEDPVSKSRFNVCAGVPMLTGQRYSSSYSSGDAVTVPSSVPAAVASSGDTVPPNLAYACAKAFGPDLILDLGTLSFMVKVTPRFSIGVAEAMDKRAEAAPSCVMKRMMTESTIEKTVDYWSIGLISDGLGS